MWITYPSQDSSADIVEIQQRNLHRLNWFELEDSWKNR